jgi:hypothetical protein
MSYKLDRRKFMSSAGSVFILPLLESILPGSQAFAQALDPRRYVALYLPDGTYNRTDRPTWYQNTGLLSAGNMGETLSIFSANAGDFSVYKNIGMSASDNLSGQIGQHPGEAKTFMTMSTSSQPTTSFDQIIGAKTGKKVYLIDGNTADSGPQDGDNNISYLNGTQLRGLSNPGDMYRDLLGKVVPSTATPPTSTPVPAPVTNSNKSIIDAALQDLNHLKNTLSRSDQTSLDQYLSGLRALEVKLVASNATNPSTVSSGGLACKSPVNNPNVDKTSAAGNGALYMERFQTFNDLIAIAFACDISRSVSVMFYPESADLVFPSISSNLRFNGVDIEGWYNHNISHFGHVDGGGSGDYSKESADGIPRCITRDRFFFSIFIDLINKLKATKDPSGSAILDNTIVHLQYGVKDGMHHSNNTPSAPLVVGGGRNFMTPGQSFDYSNYDVADMFYTFNKTLGLGLSSFGGSSKTMKL